MSMQRALDRNERYKCMLHDCVPLLLNWSLVAAVHMGSCEVCEEDLAFTSQVERTAPT